MTDNLVDHIDDVEPATLAPFGPLGRVMLCSPDGSSSFMLQHRGRRPLHAVRPTDDVTVTHASGDVTECTWADIANDSRSWLRREAQLVVAESELLLDQLPFSADGFEWNSTRGDEVFGEGDWEITANGESMSFDPQSLEVRHTEPAASTRPGTWVEVTCAGVSMSTGNIGWMLEMDEHDDSPTDSVEVVCTDFDGTWDEVPQP